MKQVKKVKDQNCLHRENDKCKARRKRRNEKVKLNRLKQRFSGTGMRKKGLFKEAKKKESAKSIQKKSRSNKKTMPTHVIEENNVEGFISHEENREFLSVVDEGNNQVPSVFDATRVIHLERRAMLEDEVNQTELLNEKTESDSIHQRTPKPWNQRMKERLDDWESSKDILYKAFVSAKAYIGNVCSVCSQELKVYVKCLTCKVTCCATCDQTLHCNSPFHERSLFTDTVSENLLPTSFINTDGKVIHQDVAVPCVVPANCQQCLKTGKLRLHPGPEKIAVVTKEGRFDLSYPEFKCSECEGVMKAAEDDLISSGWWPGSPKNMSYLFSADLLIMWNHFVHKTPGTSERKFIETLCEISKRSGRSGTICRQTFAISNKYYQYMEYLVEVEAKLRELFTCKACGRRPLAMHIDGIMKLYRWLSSKGVDYSQLLNDIGIVSDAVFQEHAEKINQIKPKLGKVSKDTCGGASYKAGKSDSVNGRTGLAETGIVFCTCRHGYLVRGVDMAKGETYRHVHYLHDYALRSGCVFLCYDVVCQYWTFAEDLSKANNEFKPHTEIMKPFLSRWHGKTHAWYCQILYSGHWMKGAGLTTGETTEQSNSKMARYGSSTKHMSRANRRDHLTQAMIYYNTEKEERMPKLLPKMLASAKANVIRYESEFNRLVTERQEKMLDLKKNIDDKLAEANAALIRCTQKIEEIIKLGPPNPESLARSKKLKDYFIQITSIRGKLKAAKIEIASDIRMNILEKLPVILEKLKEEARRCKNKRISPKTPLSVSQRSLEGIHVIIKNLKNRIATETDSSKQRIALKKEMRKYIEKAGKILEVLNPQLDGEVVTMDDCYRGVFPWQSLYDISFQENFNLVDAWMLAARSKEEIVHVEEEMKRFHCGLMDAKKKLEEQSEILVQFDDLFVRGKAFLMRSEIRRINRLLQDCHWVPCDTIPDSDSLATPVAIDEIDDWASESENDSDDYDEKSIQDELEDREGEDRNEEIESELEDSEGECEIDGDHTELDSIIDFQFE